MNVAAALVYLFAVGVLVTLFVAANTAPGRTLPTDLHRRVAVTPATTLSRFGNHFVAGFFHTSPLHIGFNLTVFTVGFFLAIRTWDPLRTVLTSYATSTFTVLLLHLFLVLPLARMGLPYAVRALDYPLVGFSVIAYATLGAGLLALPAVWAATVAGLVVVFEVGASLLVTGPFVSVYHLAGFFVGFYLRWTLLRPVPA